MRDTLTLVLLIAALAATPSAQAVVWDVPKASLFPETNGRGVDIVGGDNIDLDGNPATAEWVAVSFEPPYTGLWSTIVHRNGFYCRTVWFSLASQTDFQWYRLEKHGGITRAIVQASPSERYKAVALPLPSSCP